MVISMARLWSMGQDKWEKVLSSAPTRSCHDSSAPEISKVRLDKWVQWVKPCKLRPYTDMSYGKVPRTMAEYAQKAPPYDRIVRRVSDGPSFLNRSTCDNWSHIGMVPTRCRSMQLWNISDETIQFASRVNRASSRENSLTTLRRGAFNEEGSMLGIDLNSVRPGLERSKPISRCSSRKFFSAHIMVRKSWKDLS